MKRPPHLTIILAAAFLAAAATLIALGGPTLTGRMVDPLDFVRRQRADSVHRAESIARAEQEAAMREKQREAAEEAEYNRPVAPTLQTLLRALASGDTATVARLAVFPVMRPYPLKPIADAAQLRRTLPVRPDTTLQALCRKGMKQGAWGSDSLCKYLYNNDDLIALVVDNDGRLRALGFATTAEMRRHDRFLRADSLSLHPSRAVLYHIPIGCFTDLTDGSTVRIDYMSEEPGNPFSFPQVNI